MAKAIVVAAPASGSGKTLITLGLLRAFRNGGVRVAAAKVGPDYIDPRFHEAATGRPCYNLDAWAMSPSQIKGLVAELARDADLVLLTARDHAAHGLVVLVGPALPGEAPASFRVPAPEMASHEAFAGHTEAALTVQASWQPLLFALEARLGD